MAHRGQAGRLQGRTVLVEGAERSPDGVLVVGYLHRRDVITAG